MKMKNLLMFIILMCLSITAYAQVDMEAGAAMLKPVLEILLGYLPANVVAIFALIGGFRSVLKPLMVFLGSVAGASGNKSLQLKYSELEGGNVYKVLVFVFDYLFSLKLPVKKK